MLSIYIDYIISYYIQHLDKIFIINFILLGFMITALTILLIVNKDVSKEFKEAGLIKKLNNKFKKTLNLHFLSGTFAFIVYFLQIEDHHYNWQVILSSISLTLFFSSLFYTYKTYNWIIFFIDHE
jgi:hypothetical protein